MTLSATPFSFLAVSGADASKFLQGQLTCDLASLEIGHIIPGAHCSAKGRVLHNFLLGKYDADTYLLQLPTSMLEIATANLKKYAVFFKVSITHETSIEVWHSPQPAAPVGARASRVIDDTLSVHWLDTGALPTDMGLSDNAAEAGYIRAGLVWIIPSTSERFTPEEIGLTDQGAVSFKKGCYTGQEIVARMHYKGAHKRTAAVFFTTAENTSEMITQTSSETSTETPSAVMLGDSAIGSLLNYAQVQHTHYFLLSIPREAAESVQLTYGGIALNPQLT